MSDHHHNAQDFDALLEVGPPTPEEEQIIIDELLRLGGGAEAEFQPSAAEPPVLGDVGLDPPPGQLWLTQVPVAQPQVWYLTPFNEDQSRASGQDVQVAAERRESPVIWLTSGNSQLAATPSGLWPVLLTVM